MTETKQNVNQLVNEVVELIGSMYNEIDQLNGTLETLLETVDEEHMLYDRINDFYIALPTWGVLDSVVDDMNELKEGE